MRNKIKTVARSQALPGNEYLVAPATSSNALAAGAAKYAFPGRAWERAVELLPRCV